MEMRHILRSKNSSNREIGVRIIVVIRRIRMEWIPSNNIKAIIQIINDDMITTAVTTPKIVALATLNMNTLNTVMGLMVTLDTKTEDVVVTLVDVDIIKAMFTMHAIQDPMSW